jgi:hypothetical protein
LTEKLSDKVYRETYGKYKCVPAEIVYIIEGIRVLEASLSRVELLPLNWRGRAKHYYEKQWFEESGILEQCSDELDTELHPKNPTEKDKKMENIMRESIGLVEKKPRWRYDCDRCGKGCKYSPTDTPPCSNMPTVKDWSIAQKKRAIV